MSRRRANGQSTKRHPAYRRMTNRGDGAPSGTDWKRHGTAMPSWADLEPDQNRRQRKSDDGSFLERVSTVRFALLILAVAALFTLYVGHVHATQQLLSEVQAAREVNQDLHLKHNRLKGEFDRKTGPSVIYERARQLGLRESITYGPEIRVE
jgi:cell division protein FtsL